MIFNSKQLEELENIHDSTGAFEEEGEDDGNFEEIGEAAMDWRRGLIEEAAESIKRAKARLVEPSMTYPIGSMLFEREARRFARVQRSVPGYLKIVYLSGGDREFGNLDVVGYLRDFGAEKRLSELSEQLGMNDVDVATELERLGITPVEEPEAEEAVAAEGPAEAAEALPPPPLPVGKKGKAAKVEEEAVDDDDEGAPALVAAAPPKGKAAASKPPPKASSAPTAKKAAAPAKGAALVKGAHKAAAKAGPHKTAKASRADKAKPPPEKTKKASSTSKINPIDDPNNYIKAHYLEMSNRELARVTGLSEHTIRRKLGEWGLKRKTA